MKPVSQEINFRGWRVPVGFHSDGCTNAPDSYLAIRLRPFELYRITLKDACRLHDFNRRHRVHYNIMTAKEADHLFRAHLRELGATVFMAGIYYLVVKITRDKYSRTQPIPFGTNWGRYLHRDAGEL